MSSAKKVHHVSTTNVRPASYSGEQTGDYQRIDLNPFDLIFLSGTYMQKCLIFNNPQSIPKQQEKQDVPNDYSVSDKITHLRTTLSSTLDHFYPLAGRLAIQKHEDDNTISIYINCNFEGVEFIHATAEISVDDILSPTYVPESMMDQLIPFNGVLNYEGQSRPLLSVQVTELHDGAIFIACSANHAVCDGASIWRFINSWSDISRSSGNRISCPPPVFERWFTKETDCPIRLPFSFAEMFSEVRSTRNSEVPSIEGLVERCFRFTKPSIAKLKARALELNLGTNQSAISSLQALLAHVWTAVIRARYCLTNSHDESRQILIALFMNNRTKLIPPLPEAYFGNSVIGGDMLVKEGVLLDKGFGFLASSLNEVVNSHNYEKNRSFFESWVEKPFIPGSGDDNGVMDLMLLARSSQWFDKYGNNFGWGCPSAVKTGRNGKFAYGITTVSRGPVEGSIDIEICLPVEVFKAMEKDVEFMEAFSC